MNDVEQSPGDGGLGYALARAAQAWRAEVATALQPSGLTPSQFFVIMAVHRATTRGKTPPSQREIGERLDMDPNTTSQVIRALEQRHLLTRMVHPGDARVRALQLTTDGRELATIASRTVRKVNRRFFAVLNSDTATQLGSTLETLTHASEQRP